MEQHRTRKPIASLMRRPRTRCAPIGAGQPWMPRDVRRRGTAMLNQQCWCWGCDIRRPQGNLLLAYGMEKWRVPEGEQGSNMYRRHIGERVVTVWAFGLWFGDMAAGDGVYLPRLDWEPRLMPAPAPAEQIWSWKQLPPALEPRDDQQHARLACLVGEALDWIGEYEAWVMHAAGIDYRQGCLEAWRKRTLDAQRLVPMWRRLARRCEQHARCTY
jgi:hypothetical protein